MILSKEKGMYENEVNVLKEADIKPSKQRVVILNYLNENADKHMTVEDIFSYFRTTENRLSLATVYNTINLFREKGLIGYIKLDNGEFLYESDAKDHAHFECKVCKNLYHLSIPDKKAYDKTGKFDIDSQQILLRGTCPSCK